MYILLLDQSYRTRHTIKEASVNEGHRRTCRSGVDRARQRLARTIALVSTSSSTSRSQESGFESGNQMHRGVPGGPRPSPPKLVVHLLAATPCMFLDNVAQQGGACLGDRVGARDDRKEASAAAWAGKRAWVLEDAEDVAKSQRKPSRLESSSKPQSWKWRPPKFCARQGLGICRSAQWASGWRTLSTVAEHHLFQHYLFPLMAVLSPRCWGVLVTITSEHDRC
ncbi:hypothetical protein JB92DRAFT_3280463 [Gautieria morchelliformis]|nr:hypothetical protein JB92DRAFT_3280463 [Gautieria morchelliformis]